MTDSTWRRLGVRQSEHRTVGPHSAVSPQVPCEKKTVPSGLPFLPGYMFVVESMHLFGNTLGNSLVPLLFCFCEQKRKRHGASTHRSFPSSPWVSWMPQREGWKVQRLMERPIDFYELLWARESFHTNVWHCMVVALKGDKTLAPYPWFVDGKWTLKKPFLSRESLTCDDFIISPSDYSFSVQKLMAITVVNAESQYPITISYWLVTHNLNINHHLIWMVNHWITIFFGVFKLWFHRIFCGSYDSTVQPPETVRLRGHDACCTPFARAQGGRFSRCAMAAFQPLNHNIYCNVDITIS